MQTKVTTLPKSTFLWSTPNQDLEKSRLHSSIIILEAEEQDGHCCFA
jgi:hypothetical protein